MASCLHIFSRLSSYQPVTQPIFVNVTHELNATDVVKLFLVAGTKNLMDYPFWFKSELAVYLTA